MSEIQKLLIGAGVLLILIALLWPLIDRLGPNFGLGRLPGDIMIERENFRFYFTLTTMIIISLVASILIWLFKR